MMLVAQMGSILITIFTSSTSVRVDMYHLFINVISAPFSDSLIAALSKNLQKKD